MRWGRAGDFSAHAPGRSRRARAGRCVLVCGGLVPGARAFRVTTSHGQSLRVTAGQGEALERSESESRSETAAACQAVSCPASELGKVVTLPARQCVQCQCVPGPVGPRPGAGDGCSNIAARAGLGGKSWRGGALLGGTRTDALRAAGPRARRAIRLTPTRSHTTVTDSENEPRRAGLAGMGGWGLGGPAGGVARDRL